MLGYLDPDLFEIKTQEEYQTYLNRIYQLEHEKIHRECVEMTRNKEHRLENLKHTIASYRHPESIKGWIFNLVRNWYRSHIENREEYERYEQKQIYFFAALFHIDVFDLLKPWPKYLDFYKENINN